MFEDVTDEEGIKDAKDAGNRLLKEGRLEEALPEYGRAIELCGSDRRKEAAVCYSNRSLALTKLDRFEEALSDAIEAVKLDPTYAKGHFRKGKALEGLGRDEDASKALRQAKGVESKQKVKHKAYVQKQKEKEKQKKMKEKLKLYDDRDDAYLEENTMTKGAKVMYKRLRESVMDMSGANTDPLSLNGVFAKMSKAKDFQKLVFPGIPEEELKSAPKSLQELLANAVYSNELEGLMPKVEAKADSVLNNVKAKGVAQGDVMDPQTEAMLRPQVLKEAFAREIVAMVNRVNRQQHAQRAKDTQSIASPLSELATWDQLDPETLQGLLKTDGGFAVQDEFMGDEWCSVILKDIVRLSKAETMAPAGGSVDERAAKLGPGFGKGMDKGGSSGTGAFAAGEGSAFEKAGMAVGGTAGEMLWVDANTERYEEEYPALHELLTQLHALPFELNKKARLSLSIPFPGSTMMTRMMEGDEQPPRLDSGSGENDTGYKLTAVYFLSAGWEKKDGGELLLRNCQSEPDADGDNEDLAKFDTVEPLEDRLVIFRSRHMLNAIAKRMAAKPQYAVTFWIHGGQVEDLD
jgi:tetratricopeptide (TPR) repeat protein